MAVYILYARHINRSVNLFISTCSKFLCKIYDYLLLLIRNRKFLIVNRDFSIVTDNRLTTMLKPTTIYPS